MEGVGNEVNEEINKGNRPRTRSRGWGVRPEDRLTAGEERRDDGKVYVGRLGRGQAGNGEGDPEEGGRKKRAHALQRTMSVGKIK